MILKNVSMFIVGLSLCVGLSCNGSRREKVEPISKPQQTAPAVKNDKSKTDSHAAKRGARGGPCRLDGTCDDHLTCLFGRCELANDKRVPVSQQQRSKTPIPTKRPPQER